MANDIDINSLDVRNASDDDYLIGAVSGRASRVKCSSLMSSASQWSKIQNKPFDSMNIDDFTISVNTNTGGAVLGVSNRITDNIHSHTNKNILDKFSEKYTTGELMYDGEPLKVSDINWENIVYKPFDGLSDDFIVSDSIVSLSETITDTLHTHDNKDIIDKFSVDSDGTLLFDSKPIESENSSLDFSALSNALTGGTLTGLIITPNTETETFDIEVSDIEVSIDNVYINDDGYWVINDTVTTSKAVGENGSDGITPTINADNKHWFIGEEDTGIVAQGEDGYSPIVNVTESDDGIILEVTIKSGEFLITKTKEIHNGKSAYQLALDSGFGGTESDWLTSLHGENGITTISTTKIDKTCVLTADGWSNTIPYSQTISVDGITEILNPRVDVIISDDVTIGLKEQEAFANITKMTTGNGIVTAYCYKKKPNIDLNIMIEVV